jgi:hypothetical protein
LEHGAVKTAGRQERLRQESNCEKNNDSKDEKSLDQSIGISSCAIFSTGCPWWESRNAHTLRQICASSKLIPPIYVLFRYVIVIKQRFPSNDEASVRSSMPNAPLMYLSPVPFVRTQAGGQFGCCRSCTRAKSITFDGIFGNN